MKFGYFCGEPSAPRIILKNYDLKTLNISKLLKKFSHKLDPLTKK